MYRKLTFFILALLPSSALAEILAFGGPPVKGDFNALSTPHAFSNIIRESVSYPLLRYKDKNTTLVLAKSSKFSDMEWSFRLKEDLSFSNKSPINLSDVIWSLNRCKSGGSFQAVKEFSWKQDSNFKDRKWLTVSFIEKPDFESEMKNLSTCLILEEKSSVAFGEDLGAGTNLVSSGRYIISNFKEGKNIILKLIKSDINIKRIEELELRGVDSAEGLSYLRSGTFLIFFTEDQVVLDKAKLDPTLKTGKCGDYSYAARGDFKYDCEKTFDVAEIY